MEQHATPSRAKKIFGVGVLLFIVLGCLIMLLCNFRVQYASQAILNQQRDLEQLWLNRAVEAIASWRNEVVEQARFISSSEMFRLFITDALDMEKEDRQRLHEPDSLHSSSESLRSMAEQLTYLRDLLKDFTARRAWNEARVLLPNGNLLVGPEFPLPLLESQRQLCEEAAEAAKPVFGQLRIQDGILVMDMADPLFEVLGASEPKPVGVLLLSIPMDRILATFLSSQTEHHDGMMPRIISLSSEGSVAAMIDAGVVSLEKTKSDFGANYPFMLRNGVVGTEKVYSMGAKPTGLNWQYLVEIPANLVDARIHEQKVQIYALGGLASLGLALLGALIWASVTSKQHRARVEELTRLNRQIDQQRSMLQSINSSMTAGLLLVDDHDNILVTNPNFHEIIKYPDAIPAHTPLTEVAPPNLALKIQQNMRQVMSNEKLQSTEMELGEGEDRRLYRVTLYPYIENAGTKEERCAGCVAIFQDITLFRHKAQIQKEREEAMLSALGRAIESIDPGLMGHSEKMSNLSTLIADQMDLNDDQRATLRIAARLSQVGKLFVPRELLTRDGALTPEELAEVRRAPEYGDRILHDLHFDLPIQTTVNEMGQKMDESGNIAGTQTKMSQCGKTLAVINAFIAMISPRKYRKSGQMSYEEAIEILRTTPGFCRQTIAALAKIPNEQLKKAVK